MKRTTKSGRHAAKVVNPVEACWKVEIQASSVPTWTEPMNHRWSILTLAVASLSLAGLMYWAQVAQIRSTGDLEFADHCVDWAHKTRDARTADGPDIASKCTRYFRVRSDKNADEDEIRWKVRTGGS